jgi:peptidyl-prolyl cis-trans isomerase D
MFDLFRSREKSVRILLGALLVVVALSMLTYLIPNYDTGSRGNETVVARVGDELITTIDVQKAVQTVVKGRQLPPDMLASYIPQIIENMVTERAVAYQAERMGIQITDADVADAIRTQIPSLFPEGKFVGKEAYAGMLAQQNVSIKEFEHELKRSLLLSRLRNLASEGVIALPAEIEAEYRRRNDKTKVEYVRLINDKYRAEINVTDADLQRQFQYDGSKYRQPEKRSMSILVADQAKVTENLTLNEAELLRAYEQNKESYRVPDRVKVRHILLKTNEKPASEEPKIKARAEELLKQIKAGGNFSELAKKNSEDTGSAEKGGELPDWVTKGQTVPEFEKTAFAMNPGQTSDLVKTQYGYHILQLLQKETARLKPLAEVRNELTEAYKKQRGSEIMEQIANRAQSELQKDPANPQKVATALGMEFYTAENAGPGDPIPGVGVSKVFDDSLIGVKKGEVTQPVALSNVKIAIAVVTAVTPARPSTLAEVRDKVRDTVVAARLSDLLMKKANELVQKANASGSDLKAAAKAMGLEVKVSDDFTRNGAVEGVGSAAYLQDAFVKPVGAILGPLGIADGRVVIKVLSHTPADPSQMAEQRTAIREELKARKSRDRSMIFEAGLRQKLIQQGKIKLYQDVIARVSQGYRGGA